MGVRLGDWPRPASLPAPLMSPLVSRPPQVFPLLVARRLNVLRRPFEIFGRYVLTQVDVQDSKLIRDLIQLLVNNVLKALFPSLHLTFFDVSVRPPASFTA